jgi:hypothetical protein
MAHRPKNLNHEGREDHQGLGAVFVFLVSLALLSRRAPR